MNERKPDNFLLSVYRQILKGRWNFVGIMTLIWGAIGWIVVFLFSVAHGGFGAAEGVIGALTGGFSGALWALAMWEFFIQPRLRRIEQRKSSIDGAGSSDLHT